MHVSRSSLFGLQTLSCTSPSENPNFEAFGLGRSLIPNNHGH